MITPDDIQSYAVKLFERYNQFTEVTGKNIASTYGIVSTWVYPAIGLNYDDGILSGAIGQVILRLRVCGLLRLCK